MNELKGEIHLRVKFLEGRESNLKERESIKLKKGRKQTKEGIIKERGKEKE